MSGHNKWSSIKHKKSVADQKKGRQFSKLSKLITIAAQDGLDPKGNPKLQTVIDKAKSLNMPKDNIERATERANQKNSSAYYEMLLQALDQSGVSLIITAVTDNKNRTLTELKSILNKQGAKIAGEGSLDYLFERRVEEGNVHYKALYPMPLSDTDKHNLGKLIEELEGHEDVDAVFSNDKKS